MTEFNLEELGLRITGRSAVPVSFSEGRELLPGDIAKTQEPKGSTPAPIKRLRERHHALARMLAQGVGETDAAITCGYTPSRVSILKDDPTFKELLTFYSKGVTERYYDMHEAASALGRDAVEELHTRLEDEPEDFSIGMLLDLSKTMMDRTGHGPSSSTKVDVRVGLADKLEAARKRTISARAVDITPEEE